MNLLAVDFGSLFAVAFLLISFIGWIMNLINAQNPPPQPNRPARKPQPRDRKVQTEIEDFLQQAMGRRGPQQQKGASDGIEIIEPRETRRPPSRQPLGPSQAGPVPSPREQVSKPVPLAGAGKETSSRQSVGSSDLGTSLRTRVEQHMGSRVGQRVEQDLPHFVDQSISAHLGQFRADDNDTRRGVAPAIGSRDSAAFLAELRKPSGMRKAIVLQEILSKPLSLRKG